MTWASASGRRFSPRQDQWVFEVEGRGLGVSAALPRWLCGRRPEVGGDGSEHAGIRAG